MKPFNPDTTTKQETAAETKTLETKEAIEAYFSEQLQQGLPSDFWLAKHPVETLLFKHLPAPETMQQLSTEEQNQALTFLSKELYAVAADLEIHDGSIISARMAEAVSEFAQKHNSELAQQFLQTAISVIQLQKNTNTAGNYKKDVSSVLKQAAELYTPINPENGHKLYNPYELQAGSVYYSIANTGLEKHTIKDIDIDADESGVELDTGEIVSLSEINKQISSGTLALEQGNGYFGSPEELPETVRSLQPQDPVRLEFKVPGSSITAEGTFVGTNLAELKQQYSLEHLPLPAVRKLLIITINSNSQEDPMQLSLDEFEGGIG